MSDTIETGRRYADFDTFYPFYLGEHSNTTSRRLHVIGTGLSLVMILLGVALSPWFFIAAPVCGYFFAWVGHFFFEKNQPATFTYPIWSLMGDFRMFFETVSGRRAF